MKRVSSFCLGFFIVILSFASSLQAATYYVDATNGDDYNDGLSPSTAWKTIAKVNNSSFYPGDFILFKRGETWREQLTVPSSGSKGNPITFGAYGIGKRPIINGADLVTGWSSTKSSFLFKTTQSAIARVVIFDGAIGKEKKTFSELAYDGDWFMDSDNNALYVYSASEPNRRTIEVGKRNYALCDNGSSRGYIKVENLEFQGANSRFGGAVDCRGDGGPWTIQNCIIKNIASFGVMTMNNNCIINGNDISYCGETGIFYHQDASGSTLFGNTISYNQKNGIDVSGDSGTIEHNLIHHNGWNGIVLEGRPSTGISAENNAIRRNNIYSNGQARIVGDFINRFEIYFLGGRFNDVSYNLIHDANDGGAAIYLDFGANHNTFYNNTIFNILSATMGYGIAFENGPEGASCENNRVKNNIFSNCRIAVAFALNVYDLQGNILDYNCFHLRNGTYLIQDWSGTYYTTLTNWQAKEGGPDLHSISGEPQFRDPKNGDLSLGKSSPCIDAGTDVGLTWDFADTLVPQGSGVDIGAFEYTEDRNPPAIPTGLRIQ